MTNPDLKYLVNEFTKLPIARIEYNPFATWGMTENDHTKLLVAFLRYNDDRGGFPILRNFLHRFAKVSFDRLTNVKVEFNQGCGGNGYIDGYITFVCDGLEYAVVVENKIYDAPDQERQIQRYIEYALKDIRGNSTGALQRIWVLYITRDGSKTVSENSYSLERQSPSTNIGDRFIEINYKDHIIDWLSEVVEDEHYAASLINVAKVYLEYLVYEFRNKQNLSEREMLLLSKMGIDKDLLKINQQQVEDLNDLRVEIQNLKRKSRVDEDNDAINNISSALSEVLLKLEKLAFDKFEELTKIILDEWTEKEGLKWQVAHRGLRDGSGYLQLRLVDEWGSAHMEWEPIGVCDMLFGRKYQFALHLEGHRHLRKDWVDELKKNMSSLPTKGEIGASSRLFKWTVTTDKPFCEMDEAELKQTLTKLYTEDSSFLFSMLIRRLNDYTK